MKKQILNILSWIVVIICSALLCAISYDILIDMKSHIGWNVIKDFCVVIVLMTTASGMLLIKLLE